MSYGDLPSSPPVYDGEDYFLGVLPTTSEPESIAVIEDQHEREPGFTRENNERVLNKLLDGHTSEVMRIIEVGVIISGLRLAIISEAVPGRLVGGMLLAVGATSLAFYKSDTSHRVVEPNTDEYDDPE